MVETRRISTLIESQLPEFIINEYENFSKVIEKYYEQLELRGNPLDVISNITKYRDIDFYEKNLLKESTKVVSYVDAVDTTIRVEDATSFPETDGYISIGSEIIFYKSRTDTEFREVSRGVSGNQRLGDLYSSSQFVTTLAENHDINANVQNISNLFLYAFVKNFENDYLASFPEKYLKDDVDKRTLIKNITDFYQAKGTDRSIQFIFNTLVSNDKPKVLRPKDNTLKSSFSDWITSYALKVIVLEGNADDLIGETIIQNLDPLNESVEYASAIVDNVFSAGSVDGLSLYEITIDTATLNNQFGTASKTRLTDSLPTNSDVGDRINVFSTEGFLQKGRIYINGEEVQYSSKNVDQFVISRRERSDGYAADTNVYSYSTITSGDVRLLCLGVLYNLEQETSAPYSEPGDRIQISEPGFTSIDPILIDTNGNLRWFENAGYGSSGDINVGNVISKLKNNISAVYRDENYYYLATGGLPNRPILYSGIGQTLSDQKILRLIRKKPLTITESYETSQRDVGIFVDGTIAFSHKDFDQIKYGKITKFNIENKGNGYNDPPNVLINGAPGLARTFLSGETIGSIELETDNIFTSVPEVTITSGRGAEATAVVTFGAITSINVVNSGEYYSTPPRVVITDKLGKGRFAEYKAILVDGKIVSFESVDQGKFYSKGNVIVEIFPVGRDGLVTCDVFTWTKNRYNKLQPDLDNNNSYVFPHYNPTRGFGYGVCASPTQLRTELSDDGTGHSPILGFAYDGNPIYGPFGFENPLDSTSTIGRIRSAYRIKATRIDGPSVDEFPIGTFIQDYEWVASTSIGKTELDENNGRFCVTPEYPTGTYAYFISVDSDDNPTFPYILGNNFYSLPVDSNYNADLTQDDLPTKAERYRIPGMDGNGSQSMLTIAETLSGNVETLSILNSTDQFKVGGKFQVSDVRTDGSGASAFVSSVVGKDILSMDCKSLETTNTKSVALVRLISPTYLFENDIVTQEDSAFTGKVISDISNRSEFVLEEVSGTFVEGKDLNSSSTIISILIDRNVFFTAESTLLLTDGADSTLATGRVLESVSNQNSVKVEVLSGEFVVPDSVTTAHFLQSTTLGDSVGGEVVVYSNLSKEIKAFAVRDDLVLVETDGTHNVGVNSYIDVEVDPDVSQTTTEYYVRKRFYQEIKLKTPSFGSLMTDTGVGRGDLLNGGLAYTSGNYVDVELIFLDQSRVRNGIGSPGDSKNAIATINVSDFNGTGYGSVSDFTITNKGSDYIKGDILTVADADLGRLSNAISSQRLAINVDHIGLAQLNTKLSLVQVNKLSENDLLKIDSEIVKVVSIDSSNREVTIERGIEGSNIVDHFDGTLVSLYKGVYRFDANSRPLGIGPNDPTIISYDSTTQNIVLAYDYSSTSPREVTLSSVFQDNSSPKKSIALSSVVPGENRLEFSKDVNFATFGVNTDIRIQKYYNYVFDTSHVSMQGVFLDFSASRTGTIFTEEKIVSGIQPGNAGSFVSITLGFGPNIVGQTQQRFPVNFDTYYYFIKSNSDVNTDGAALRVIDDPIAGSKQILFSSQTKFAYAYTETPDYNGKGSLRYNTDSPFAIGKIKSATIDNKGIDYKRLPVITGCNVDSDNQPNLKVQWDSITKTILGVEILQGGKNFVSPKAYVSRGDGTGAVFNVFQDAGRIVRIDVVNEGSGYNYIPEITIYEGGVEAYFGSNNIGLPKNVSIVKNGGGYHNDTTILPKFTSHYALIIRGQSKFFKGERVEQRDGNRLVFSAIISDKGWRLGTNIIRLEKITGNVDFNLPLVSVMQTSRSVEVVDVLSTQFKPTIKSFSDNMGRFTSDKGKIGDRNQRLTDSFFYQDYSYVIQSKTPINTWRDLIKQTTHPAGFLMFGEVVIESEQESSMPIEQPKSDKISFIELAPKNVTVERKSTRVTQSSIRVRDTNLRRGVGSVSINEYDTEGILSKELILAQDFSGRYATQEDYIGPIKSITKVGDGTSEIAVGFGGGTNFTTIAGEYNHWVKFKMLGNTNNQPAITPYVDATSPAQSWSGSLHNYSILPNDEYVTSGGGNFDLSKINLMTIGFMPEFGEFSSNQGTSNTEFGAVIQSNESDFSEIASGFEVGDTITFYENASTFVKVEVVNVDSPAYHPTLGVIGDGNVLGRRTFQLLDKANNLAYSPYNEQETFITLNGVAQEPKKAYEISGSQITFASAPLGPQYPITGENFDDTYTTDPTKFVCKSFKFKNDTFNDKYLKKIKDISGSFDGISTEFALSWDDDTIVKTDTKENLLIFVNGVLQAVNTAYTIRRSANDSQTDIIVFIEPPRNFYDVIDYTPEQLDQKEYFYGYGVGSYDRLRIDERLIPYRGEGPYLVFDEETDTVKNINEADFALVFVDGVLQAPDTYKLNGPNISFTEKLIKYIPSTGESLASKVEIISLFGRQVPKTLSAYDYDRIIFRNEVSIVLTKVLDDPNGKDEYIEWQENFTAFDPSVTKNVFTFDDNGNRVFIGKLNSVRFDLLEDGTATGNAKPGVVAEQLTIKILNAENLKFTANDYDPRVSDDDELRIKGIFITDQTDFTDFVSFNSAYPIFKIDWEYSKNADGERVLVQDIPDWLKGSKLGDDAYFNLYNNLVDIAPGDEIMIDGEKDYRKILYIPPEVKGRNFNNGQTAKFEHYSPIEVTNYNDIVRGEGLSVTCTIGDGGAVTGVGFSDLEWNRRDLKLFFDTGILLQPTAYQYFVPPQVKFIPVDGRGGGARAEVLTIAGQVLDVILLEGGSGYTQPPRAVVTRGYNVLRKPNRTIQSNYRLEIGTQIGLQQQTTIATEIIISGQGQSTGLFSLISFGIVGSVTPIDNDEIVNIITPEAEEVGDQLGLPEGNSIIFTNRDPFTAIDQVASELLINETLITVTLDNPIASITNISPAGGVDVIINNLQKIINTPIAYFREESASATGALLDSPLSPIGTTLYVNNTSLFADVGKLQVGREIVGYERKLQDRFLNVTRGLDRTVAVAHPAGQYIRTIPDSVRVIDAGPRSIIATIVSVAQSDVSNIEVKNQIHSISDIVDVQVDTNLKMTLQKEIQPSVTEVSVAIQNYVISLTESSVLMSSESVSVAASTIQSINSAELPQQVLTDVIEYEIAPYLTYNDQVITLQLTSTATPTESSVLMSDESVSVVASTIQTINNASIVTEKALDLHTSQVETSVSQSLQIFAAIPPSTDPGGLNSPIPVASILSTETALYAVIHGTETEVAILGNHLPVIDGKDKPADITLNREMGVLDFFEELVVLETSVLLR
jgi:hypothetical protein